MGESSRAGMPRREDIFQRAWEAADVAMSASRIARDSESPGSLVVVSIMASAEALVLGWVVGEDWYVKL